MAHVSWTLEGLVNHQGRVLLVEDDEPTRDALRMSLRLAGFEVVGSFPNGVEAIAALPTAGAEIVLIDLGLPGMSGVETIRRLRAMDPDLPILVLTVMESPATVVEAIAGGATGYLLKDTPLGALPAAIEQVKNGLSPLSPAIARHVIATMRTRAPELNQDIRLTPREIGVLELLVDGFSYPAIGSDLHIGLGTVQSHMKSIYRKLGVSSKAEAAAMAVRFQLIPTGHRTS